MILRSIRARLTFYYTLALAAIMLLFSAGVYLMVRADLLRQMDLLLKRDLRTLSAVSSSDLEDPAEIERQGGVELYQITSSGRTIRSKGWEAAGLDSAGSDARSILSLSKDASIPRWTWHSPRHATYYLMAGKAVLGGEEQEAKHPLKVTVIVARDADLIDRSLGSLATMILVGFPFGIGLAIVGGYFMAGRALSPIGEMATKARAITADRLSERLPVHNPKDELGRLATSFNSTLARLEDSFDRLRRFTSDASHELRTPLAAIKSVGEVALRSGQDPAACHEAISSMLEETDRLARLTDSLLTLTRADAGTALLSLETIDVAAVVAEVVDCLKVLADEKDLSLSVNLADGIAIAADRATLRQAIINLLDNAIKYTPSGGKISVSLAKTRDRTTIEVTDTGPGIAAEHRDHVFERFYRAEKARSGPQGAGLGLAIAKWAVESNSGTIELETQEKKGSTFRIVFPAGKEVNL